MMMMMTVLPGILRRFGALSKILSSCMLLQLHCSEHFDQQHQCVYNSTASTDACWEWWRLLRRPPGLHRPLCRTPAESAGELPSFSRNPNPWGTVRISSLQTSLPLHQAHKQADRSLSAWLPHTTISLITLLVCTYSCCSTTLFTRTPCKCRF